jgi:hypothetical protein
VILRQIGITLDHEAVFQRVERRIANKINLCFGINRQIAEDISADIVDETKKRILSKANIDYGTADDKLD